VKESSREEAIAFLGEAFRGNTQESISEGGDSKTGETLIPIQHKAQRGKK